MAHAPQVFASASRCRLTADDRQSEGAMRIHRPLVRSLSQRQLRPRPELPRACEKRAAVFLAELASPVGEGCTVETASWRGLSASWADELYDEHFLIEERGDRLTIKGHGKQLAA